MIAVLSFDTFEQGTNPVIDWLLHYRADFVRIGINDICRTSLPWNAKLEQPAIHIGSRNLVEEINVIWYRRFFHDFKLGINTSAPHHNLLEAGAKSEMRALFNYCCQVFREKKWLPHYNSFMHDEPGVLLEAASVGLRVPRGIITNNKQDLLSFNAACPSGIITKAMTDEGKSYYRLQEEVYFSHTYALQQNSLQALEEQFFPSLFQERIEASYELRIFYLDGDFYSTAILCQGKMVGEPDRKLYDKKALHQVCYKLPAEVEKQLDTLMRRLGMNTGCIDMIRGVDGKYYFLEVNVVGQYLSQSVKCNYYLEEKIAKWLIEHDTKEIHN